MSIRTSAFSTIRRTKRVGASLMEMTFVLLVMVGIIAGALAMASGVMSQNTVSQEVQTLTNLSAVVVRTKGPTGYTNGNEIKIMIDEMKLIPSNITRTGQGNNLVLRNAWGGAIDFSVTADKGNFIITSSAIPKSECIQIIGALKSAALRSVGKGTTVTNNIHELSNNVIANTLCKDANNTISWGSELL